MDCAACVADLTDDGDADEDDDAEDAEKQELDVFKVSVQVRKKKQTNEKQKHFESLFCLEIEINYPNNNHSLLLEQRCRARRSTRLRRRQIKSRCANRRRASRCYARSLTRLRLSLSRSAISLAYHLRQVSLF